MGFCGGDIQLMKWKLRSIGEEGEATIEIIDCQDDPWPMNLSFLVEDWFFVHFFSLYCSKYQHVELYRVICLEQVVIIIDLGLTSSLACMCSY